MERDTFVLLSGNDYFIVPALTSAVQLHAAGRAEADTLQVLCAAGRELEGFGEFWDEGRRPDESYLRCIDVYLSVTHRARRAALQTVAGLRELGLPRDVAVLIGRAVYDTRLDAWAWR